MGLPLSSAVQWWGEWQLQVLVLGSLGTRCVLAIFANFRKSDAPQWFKFVTWLAFLGSDAVAIYALSMLFNRQRYQHPYNSASKHDSHDLQVLWAPILLMHLGGQAGITAYNIEDNELWRRHIVTALSQDRIAVVLWVIYKSWGSMRPSFQAAVFFLSFGGIPKCLQKPWALKRASFNCLANSCGPAQRTASTEEELEKYVEQARAFVLSEDTPRGGTVYKPGMLFTDWAYPYSDRFTNMKIFFSRRDQTTHNNLKYRLSNIFIVLYTKDKIIDHPKSCVSICYAFKAPFLMIPLILALLVIGVVAKKSVDRTVTLALLFGTFVLEFLTYNIKDYFRYKQWPDMVAKHSVLGYFARNRRHNMLVRFMRFFQCKDLLDQNWSMEPCHSSMDITKLIHQHVRDGWKEYIKDVESYREFNDIRGQWTLVRESCDQSLGWSLEKPFDESVLIWHIATDFCFHQMDTPFYYECASRSREISNYMMHLLFMNPEMLMPGNQSNLFKTVYRELRDILKGEGTTHQERGIALKTIDKLKRNADAKITFIYDAWVLAKGLMDIGDESKMWKVVQGVWLEMLCFSAGRCRGYLHAKSLGSGVEYLSFVWLLLADMGMETFSERIQRTMSIKLLKKRTGNLANRGSDNNTISVSPDEGAGPLKKLLSYHNKSRNILIAPTLDYSTRP